MELKTTKPSEMRTEDRSAFIDFVREAGEVDPATLPRLVDDAVVLVTMYEGDTLIGTAAVKRPLQGHRSNTFKKANDEKAAAEYPLEIGWVHVHPDYRRKGCGVNLVEAALGHVASGGVYATTKSDAMRSILAALGFNAVGIDYKSTLSPDEMLSLFARAHVKVEN